MVAENSVVDKSSLKLVDESSVLVENTSIKPEEIDKKSINSIPKYQPALLYMSCF